MIHQQKHPPLVWDSARGILTASGDPRDYTKELPFMLNPLWVLKMRKKTKHYIETGEWVLK